MEKEGDYKNVSEMGSCQGKDERRGKKIRQAWVEAGQWRWGIKERAPLDGQRAREQNIKWEWVR